MSSKEVRGSTITEPAVYRWLQEQKVPECALTSKELRSMAKEIIDCIHEEEMEYGECYESVDDADIAGLCNSSTTDLHHNWYNLIFGPMYDDEYEE